MNTDFYTYIYYDPSRNNEPIYVGKGQKQRAWAHLKRKDKHPFTHRIQLMKKNNVLPIIGVYGGLDEEFALLLEEELINKFGRKDLGTGTLLNLTDGGDTPINLSAEARKKMSDAAKSRVHTDEYKRKMSISCSGRIVSEETRARMSGKTPSEETKAKLSISNVGKVRSEETRAKMRGLRKPLSVEHRAKLSASVRAANARKRLNKEQNGND